MWRAVAALSPARITLVRRAVAPPLAGLTLAVLLATGVLLCLHAAAAPSGLIPASWHGMPGWMAGPLPGVGTGLTAPAFAALFVAMCACYLATLLLPLDARLTVGAIVLLHVAFMLAPPLLSSDVFGYIDWARLGVLHGLDPYAHGSLAAPHDAAFAYFRWRTAMPSPYGPAFTVLSYATAPLGVAGAFWAMKAVCAAASLGVVALVASCARRLGIDPLRAAAFVGLNPLLLVWAIGGAHNDLLATVTVLGGVRLALAGRARGGGALLALAAALKASAGVVLPYAVIGARERRRALTGALLAAGAVVVAALAVFGTDVTGFVQANRDQQQMVARTSVPNQIGVLLGSGGITPAIRAVAFAILAVTLAWTLWRAWHGANWIACAGWATLALIACSAWVMPWYAVWLLPLAAIGRDRRLTVATLLLCAYLVAVRTPF
jgi:alpha-1,6-mannosyltransferase